MKDISARGGLEITMRISEQAAEGVSEIVIFGVGRVGTQLGPSRDGRF